MPWLLLLTGIAVAVLGSWRWRSPRVQRGVAIACSATLCLLLTGFACYLLWISSRPQPTPIHQPLFEGIWYHREARDDPRPMVIHVASIDLDAPGIRLLVSGPGSGDGTQALRAMTTGSFLARSGCQLAINGSFFEPWNTAGPVDYYPREDEPVYIFGQAASNGVPYGEPGAQNAALYITADNRASIGQPLPHAQQILPGREVFLRDAKMLESSQYSNLSHADEPSPRTVVALDATGRRLLLVVVDGRQPGYSEGATLHELAQIIVQYGGVTALHLDGGGSTTLAMRQNDQAHLLNTPIHGRMPGRQRPVANHLGVFASPISQR